MMIIEKVNFSKKIYSVVGSQRAMLDRMKLTVIFLVINASFVVMKSVFSSSYFMFPVVLLLISHSLFL